MQTIGELNQKNSDVLGHRNNHLANGFGLGVVSVLDLVKLGNTIDEHGNLFAKVLAKLIQRVVSVLYGVVQESRNNCDGTDAEVRENLRHGQRVGDVGLATLASLALMKFFGNFVGPLDQTGIGLGVVLANSSNEGIETLSGRRLGKQSWQE
jgi:hypothetical protein